MSKNNKVHGGYRNDYQQYLNKKERQSVTEIIIAVAVVVIAVAIVAQVVFVAINIFNDTV